AMATGKPKIARSALAPLADAELSDFALAESAAEMFLALGDASTAATLAARVVARWPARKPARILIARAHLAAGNARSALTAFSEAGDLSDLPAALADRGRAYLATGDIDKAAADLDAALAADPSLTPAQIARAKVDLARDDAAAAIARLHPLIEAKAGPEVVVAYAAALARTGKTKQARALLDKLVAAGGDWHAHLQLARLARESGDFSEASEHYRAAMTNTAPVTVRIEAATALFEAGDAKAARKLIEPATSGDGASAKALILAAELAGMAGDSGDAKKLLDRAEKRPSPPTWLIDRERGRLALAANHAKDAVSHLRACVDAHGDSAEAWLLLLSAQLKLEDGAAAKKTVAQIRKQFPESATAALARGREAYYENQSGDALAAFSKAQRRLEKTNASPRRQAVAAYWIGSVHYYTGDLERAKDALDRAVKLDPSLTAAYLTLGNVEYGLERFAEAAKAYERVTELAPRANPDAWFYLGDMATRIGDTKLAKKALETYRKRAPKGDFAKEAARLLKTLP
ncbi:MAG TPA: tetratricopeptide repeat protein, partial [Kofleriaceae bacterium]|nr:tetratricopeptide repeat protein [Kofleriaceae bacterium]